jgi:hypothetical protein
MLTFATQGIQNLKTYEAKSVAVNESVAGCLLGSKSRDVNHTFVHANTEAENRNTKQAIQCKNTKSCLPVFRTVMM